MTAYRMELGEKFWEIEQEGKKLVTKTGTIGDKKKPKSATKRHPDDWGAQTAMMREIAAKTADGYAFAMPGVAYDASVTDPALDKQLSADPSDDGFEVYADWLQQKGDPRGELAVVHARLAKKPKDAKLRAAADKLLWTERGRFYGRLAAFIPKKPKDAHRLPIRATWRHGWIDALELNATSVYDDETGVPGVERVAMLLRLLPEVASARFVRSITIGPPLTDDAYDYGEPIEALLAAWPPSLRHLHIGKFLHEQSEVSWVALGSLAKLWKKAGRLERLELKTGTVDLGKIIAPELREFTITTGGLTKANLKAIINAQWPKLERLTLWLGQPEYGCDIKPKDLVPLLSSRALPKLAHLGIANTIWGDELVPYIATAPILSQLSSLDLSGSHITNAGAEALALDEANLAHLASIDLSRCLLDARGVKRVKKLAKSVNVDAQRDPGDHLPASDDPEDATATWWRYSRLGE